MSVLAEMSVLWLGLRLVASLGVILAMIVGLAKLAKRSKGLGFGLGPTKGAIVIRSREQLNRSGSIALIEVGGRALLIGSTEQSITVLAEGDDLLPSKEDDLLPSKEDDLLPVDKNEGLFPAKKTAVPSDDRTSSNTDPDGSASSGMNLIEMLREWSVRRT